MADYIDRHATAEHIDMYAKLLTMGDYRSGMMKAKEILLNQESVNIAPSIPKIIRGTDIAQVVRCKDCRKRRKDGYCTKFFQNIRRIDYAWYMPQDDDFCSYGEKREE